MQKQRLAHRESLRDLAATFGCSASHLSRVERGDTRPSRTLVLFYEERYRCDGLLLSLLEVVEHANEQKRQRAAATGGRQPKVIPGDATAFIDDTIPHGTLMLPGAPFTKTWRIRNVGGVPWRGRQLERQGPLTGPGLITSLERFVPIPDTDPGEIAEITAEMRAPTYDCTSIAYYKMIDASGNLCFPDDHQLGLDLVVCVRRNTRGSQ